MIVQGSGSGGSLCCQPYRGPQKTPGLLVEVLRGLQIHAHDVGQDSPPAGVAEVVLGDTGAGAGPTSVVATKTWAPTLTSFTGPPRTSPPPESGPQ